MQTFIDRLCRGLEYLIAAALAAMVVLVFGNVVMRYLFNSGIMVSEELSRWLFLWGTFLGAVVALHERAHLGMDLVLDKLPAAARRGCLVLAHLGMLAIVIMLFRGAWEQVKINWDVTAPTTGWSMAIVHASAAVFALLAVLVLVNDLLRLLRGREAPAHHDPEVAAAQDFINKTA